MPGECLYRKNYCFTDSEFEKLQILFSEVQNDITSSKIFPYKTKLKLLEKLEEIILQIERSMENLDSLWSFIGRIEIAFKVYGRNKIPDALKDLVKVTWQVQCRAEGREPDSLPPIIL